MTAPTAFGDLDAAVLGSATDVATVMTPCGLLGGAVGGRQSASIPPARLRAVVIAVSAVHLLRG